MLNTIPSFLLSEGQLGPNAKLQLPDFLKGFQTFNIGIDGLGDQLGMDYQFHKLASYSSSDYFYNHHTRKIFDNAAFPQMGAYPFNVNPFVENSAIDPLVWSGNPFLVELQRFFSAFE